MLGSLRNRLMLTLIAGAALLAILLVFVVRNYAVQVAQQGQDTILTASITSMLDAAALRNGMVELDLPYSAFSMLSTPADDRVFYAIFQDGMFLSGYKELSPQKIEPGQSLTFASDMMRAAAIRKITAQRLLIGANERTAIQIVLAQTQDAMAKTLHDISRNAMILGLCFFALAVMLSLWATTTTIGQLNKLSRAVTRRGPQDLRPFRKHVPQEMAPLVQSLNSLMARLEHSLSQSEDFIAEAAHRVRTPLATVRSYAEAMLQRVDKEENRDAMRSMIKAIDESSRAAGQLLDHAMITFRTDHLEREPIDLVDLTQDLIQRLTPVAEMKDLTLSLKAEAPAPYLGDTILLQNAIRNLIDNAMKYGPAESSVEITVAAQYGPKIIIRDHGPGFPQSEISSLTARYQRGSNAQGTIGSGLGLTIAEDVAKAHGGKLDLTNQRTGGACVTLSL